MTGFLPTWHSGHDVLEPELIENIDECKYYICHTSGVTLKELSQMQVGEVMTMMMSFMRVMKIWSSSERDSTFQPA